MKKHWFKFTLLALALVLGIVVWALLDTLWYNMESYEAASEIGAVTEYFDRFSRGDYDTAAETSGFVFDEKNSKEDYIRYLKDRFGNDFSDLRFAGREAEREGEKIYRIYSGDTPMGEVCLIPVTDGARNWKVVAQVEYAPALTVTAPSTVKVFANGVNVSTETTYDNEDFKGVAELFDIPQQATYTLEQYLYTPEITGVAYDGTPCSVFKQEDGSLLLKVPPKDGTAAEYEQVMKDFSQLYARYIATDATFAAVKVKMDPSTPFYEALRTFTNYWYNAHSGYEFRNWQFSDIERPADGYFAGTIRFDHAVFWLGKENVYPSAYRLSFRYKDGAWLLVDMKIL